MDWDRLLRLFLGWHSVIVGAAATCLLVLPLRFVNSPSMATIYSLASPKTWGGVLLAVALLCAIAAWRVNHLWRAALIGLATGESAWAIGLTAPLLITGQLNLLAPIAWIGIAGTAFIVAFAVRNPRS